MAEKKADIRRKQILDKLKVDGNVSYEFIMNTFHISERSMQQDIKELIKQGYDIKGVKALRGYTLRNEQDVAYFEPANTQNMRVLYVVRIIAKYKDGVSVDEIHEFMLKNGTEVYTVPNKKTLVSTLSDMVSKKIIKVKNDRYILSVNAPMQMSMSTTEAMDTLNLLETFSKGNPFEEILDGVKRQLLIALFNDDEDEGEGQYDYVVYKKDYNTAGKLSEYLNYLNSFAFEKNQLFISYKTNDNTVINTEFSVGNIVYSVDKDRLYLIGENEAGEPKVIHYKSIEKIEVANRENIIFQNDFYTSIVSDMFAISLDPVEEVEVVFDNIFRVKEKLSRVVSNRENATLVEDGDKLIYRDRISGLRDFAVYLRRFGSACEVINPLELRQMMKNTAVRTLEMYELLSESEGGLDE